MEDEFPPGDNTPSDSGTLDEWLEGVAADKGMSKQELLDEMLSSYWIFEELTGMMSDTRGVGDLESSDLVSENPSNRQGGDDTGHDGASSGGSSAPDEQDLSDLIVAFQNLATALRTFSEAESSLPEQREDDGRDRQDEDDAEEDQSEDDGEGNEEKLGQSGFDGDLGDLVELIVDVKRQLDDVTTAVDEQSARIDEHQDATANELQYVNGRISTLESAIEAAATEARVAEVEEDVRQLELSQEDLASWIEDEFDGIERVFEYLIDKTDSIEYRIGGVTDSYEEDIDPVKQYLREQKQLSEIKRDAVRRGVNKAVCSNCKEEINLAMLADPYCPGCDRSFSGLTTSGGRMFKSARLETGSFDDREEDDR